MTSIAIKTYTIVLALICGGALVWSIDQQHAAAASGAEARAWQHVVAATLAHDRATTKANHLLVVRYNELVHKTAQSQAKLLHALSTARAANAAAATQSTVYRTVSGGTVYTPAPTTTTSAPAPVATAPAAPTPVATTPTTRTS
jgi:hypothetical protein